MAVAVGSFQIGTGVIGTEYSITGLGFRPGFVRLRWSGVNAAGDSGPTRSSLQAGIGFVIANGKRGCISYRVEDNADPYQAGCALWNDEAVVRQTGSATTNGRADLSSFNADGISLVVDEAFNAEMTVFYQAYSGAEFNVIEVTEPGATGVASYTGAGFRPTYVEVFGTAKEAFSTPGGDASICFGAASGSAAANNGVLARFELASSGVGDASVYCRQTECLAIISPSAVFCRAPLYSFDDDGLSLNWLERNGARKFLLVVATGRWHVGNVTMPTNTTPFSETGMTWTPEGLMVVGHSGPESTQDAVQAVDSTTGLGGESIGFGTGPTARVLCYTRGNNDGNAGASGVIYYHQVDEIYGSASGAATPAVVSLADINSAFASDTIELVMDDAEDVAAFAWYSAYGPPIIDFRQRLVKYQQNTYSSRLAGKTLVRDVLGRTVPNHDVKPDNFLFAGGPSFPTPTKFSSLITNPATFYIESVQPTEDTLRIETNREGLFQSVLRRLAG